MESMPKSSKFGITPLHRKLADLFSMPYSLMWKFHQVTSPRQANMHCLRFQKILQECNLIMQVQEQEVIISY